MRYESASTLSNCHDDPVKNFARLSGSDRPTVGPAVPREHRGGWNPVRRQCRRPGPMRASPVAWNSAKARPASPRNPLQPAE
jgi:hypothetical protein